MNTAPVPYVLLPGTASEALGFYADVFGGEVSTRSFAEFGRADGPPDDVAHGVLRGPVDLFLADAGFDEDAVALTGVMFSLLGRATPEVTRTWFAALASGGGRVVSDLAVRPWGAVDGTVRDRFGLSWLLGYETSEG